MSEQNFEQNKRFLRALPAGRISHFMSRIYPSLAVINHVTRPPTNRDLPYALFRAWHQVHVFPRLALVICLVICDMPWPEVTIVLKVRHPPNVLI